MKIVTVGLDIAKQTFQAHGVDGKGKVVLRKRLRRVELSSFFAGVEPCLIGLEASGGAHYWFRVLSRLGHTVRLIAPQFVKPYVKSPRRRAYETGSPILKIGRNSRGAIGYPG
jgi:transposase